MRYRCAGLHIGSAPFFTITLVFIIILAAITVIIVIILTAISGFAPAPCLGDGEMDDVDGEMGDVMGRWVMMVTTKLMMVTDIDRS